MMIYVTLISGCTDEKSCNLNEPMVIDFELQEKNGKRKLLNLSEPSCQIKKVKWDFDGDGTHDSEDLNPEIPANLSLDKVTLIINGLNEVTKTFSDNSEPLELVVDFLIPPAAKVGEEIMISSLTEPADLIQDINWSFGDDLSNTENQETVYHAYDKPGTYKVELCINYDYCKEASIKITGAPRIAQVQETNPSTDFSQPTDQVATEIKSPAELTKTTTNKIQESSESSQTISSAPPYKEESFTARSVSENVNPVTKSTPVVPTPFYSVRIEMPLTAEVGQNISIEDKSTVTNAEIETYNWLIDGVVKSGKRVNYSFKNPGDYEVQLCLNGTVNCTKRTIRVKEKYVPPVYQVNFSLPASVVEGDRVEIVSNSSANITIKTFSWTIEGQSKQGEKVTHVFATPGQKKVKLCLDDRDCKTEIITVMKKEIPVAVSETIIASAPSNNNLVASEPTNTISTPQPTATPDPIPDPAPVAIPDRTSPPAPAPKEKPMDEKAEKPFVIIPEDDDFYAKNSSTPRPGFSDCAEGGWISGSTIRFTPKQKMTLYKAVVYANGNGEIEFKLGYNHNGILEEVPLSRNVNAGRSELYLNKFYMTLYPGIKYTLILSTKTDGLKIRNVKPCGQVDTGDDRLGIQHKSGYCLFELQYKY